MKSTPQYVHVVGICGVATSALAVAFHKAGAKVTGSDKGFFPPVSTELEAQGISFYAGWHPEQMFAGDTGATPDNAIIIVGTASGSQNPETAYAKERGYPIYSFAEAIGRFFAKEKSIVCVGTWGKTSSSALTSHILDSAGMDPTYMFGGVSLSHPSSARLTESQWSVFEGDEYKSSPTDPTAKFFYYRPTHLLLTAVSWDHADLYPTETSYFDTFIKLLSKIPSSGFIVACAGNSGVERVLRGFDGQVVTYGKKGSGASYTYSLISETDAGLDIVIESKSGSWHIHSDLLGDYQAENIAGCFAMCHSLGIDPEKISAGISTFKGLRRRMERRYMGDVSVIDDIAHSPEKASSVIQSLRRIYSGRIFVVFEPNIGGRERAASSKYAGAFAGADEVIIPRLTKLKVAENAALQPIEGSELATIIGQSHAKTSYIADDSALTSHLIASAKKGDIIAFLGSHGFRGMIEETITKLSH